MRRCVWPLPHAKLQLIILLGKLIVSSSLFLIVHLVLFNVHLVLFNVHPVLFLKVQSTRKSTEYSQQYINVLSDVLCTLFVLPVEKILIPTF